MSTKKVSVNFNSKDINLEIDLNEIDTMQKAQETRLGYHSYWSSVNSL